MTSRPEPDQRLIAAWDLARAALIEITPASTVGDPVDHLVEDGGVVSLRFRNRLDGYPGWLWTVSLARVDDADPTVLEAELLPADGALLAPEWVPWAERLAEYHAQQAAAAASAAADDEDDDADEVDGDELLDVDDLDAVDFDEDGSPILHAGDVDGVDIDELDDAEDDVAEDAEDDDAEDDDIEDDDAGDDDLDREAGDDDLDREAGGDDSAAGAGR